MKPVNKIEIYYNCIDKGNNRPPKPLKTISKLSLKPFKTSLKVQCSNKDVFCPKAFSHIKSQSKDSHPHHLIHNCTSANINSNHQNKLTLPLIKIKGQKKQSLSLDSKEIMNPGLNLNPTIDTLEHNVQLYNEYRNKLYKQKSDQKNVLIEQFKINCIDNPKIPFDTTYDKFKMRKFFKSFGNITKISIISQDSIDASK